MTGLSGPSLLSTGGGDTVIVSGSGFAQPLTVTYGPSNYVATCNIQSANQLSCTTSPGVGAGHTWRVTVSGSPATSSATTSYAAPAISSFSPQTISTDGTTSVTIAGSNFGPVGTSVSATYGGGTYTANACSVTVANTRVVCGTAQGVGTLHTWVLTIGGQNSPVPVGAPTTSCESCAVRH